MISDRRSASSGGEYALTSAADNIEYDSYSICKRRSSTFERVPDPATRDGHPETSYRAAKEDADCHSASNYYSRVRAESKEVYSRSTVNFELRNSPSNTFFRIKAYREEQAAIKHKEKLAIQNSKSQLQSFEKEKDLSQDQSEMPQDSFFLTQNLDEEPPVQEKEKNENEPEPTYESELSKITALAMREAELDLEQELTPIENILELTEDEKVEYSYNVEPLSQTAAYNQLRALLM